MPARDAFRLDTLGGASVLGRKEIGSIEPGKAADIAVFDFSGLDFVGPADLAAYLRRLAPHKIHPSQQQGGSQERPPGQRR